MHHFSRQIRVRCAAALVIALSAYVATGRNAEAGGPQINPETEFKARSLAVIPRFVGWPDASFPTQASPFIMGILSRDEDFVRLVSNAVNGKSIAGHPVEVRHSPAPHEIRRCHLLFVSNGAWSRRNLRGPLMRVMKDFPVLTVGEEEDFVRAGGIARFKSEQNRLSLVVNENAAKRSGLNISSKLLRLPFCTVVKDSE